MKKIEFDELKWWQKVIFVAHCSVIGVVWAVLALDLLSLCIVHVLTERGVGKDAAVTAGILVAFCLGALLLGCMVYYYTHLKDTVCFKGD